MTLKAPLSLAFLEDHPQSAARVLESTPHEASATFLSELPARVAADAAAYMIPAVAAAILHGMREKRAAAVFTEMEGSAATAILRVWPEAYDDILEALPRRVSGRLRRALNYAPHLVGARMDPSAPALSGTINAADALARLQAMDPLPDMVAVEGIGGAFLGILYIRDLVAADGPAALQTIAKTSYTPLVDVQPLTAAIDHEAWRETVVLPVLDGSGHFVGMLHRRALDASAEDTATPLPPGLQFSGHLVQVFRHCVLGVAVMVAGAIDTQEPGKR